MRTKLLALLLLIVSAIGGRLATLTGPPVEQPWTFGGVHLGMTRHELAEALPDARPSYPSIFLPNQLLFEKNLPPPHRSTRGSLYQGRVIFVSSDVLGRGGKTVLDGNATRDDIVKALGPPGVMGTDGEEMCQGEVETWYYPHKSILIRFDWGRPEYVGCRRYRFADDCEFEPATLEKLRAQGWAYHHRGSVWILANAP